MISKALDTINQARKFNERNANYLMCVFIVLLVLGILFALLAIWVDILFAALEAFVVPVIKHVLKNLRATGECNVRIMKNASSILTGVRNQIALRHRLQLQSRMRVNKD